MKSIKYSIQDAFKSLDMVEDSSVEVTSGSTVLIEKLDEDDVALKLEEEVEDVPFDLTEAEVKALQKIAEKDETSNEKTIVEATKVNLNNKKEIEDELAELDKQVDEETIETVVDVEAETTDELQKSYVGKIHSCLFSLWNSSL